jgi:hypothetical protein
VDVLDDPNIGDILTIMFQFSPLLNLGGTPDIEFFFADLRGPPTMFSGTGLPEDLSFLASPITAQSAFIERGCNDIDPFPPTPCIAPTGTFTARVPATEVPEPGTIFWSGAVS